MTSLLAWGVGLILGGGSAAVVWRRTPRVADGLFLALVGTGCLLAAVPAVSTLLGHTLPMHAWEPSMPGGTWVVGLDPLSAWFLLLIALVGAACAVYGVSYLAAERAHRPTAPAHLGFAVLVAAIVLLNVL